MLIEFYSVIPLLRPALVLSHSECSDIIMVVQRQSAGPKWLIETKFSFEVVKTNLLSSE